MAFEPGGARTVCVTASSILRDNPYIAFDGHGSQGQLQDSTEEHLPSSHVNQLLVGPCLTRYIRTVPWSR